MRASCREQRSVTRTTRARLDFFTTQTRVLTVAEPDCVGVDCAGVAAEAAEANASVAIGTSTAADSREKGDMVLPIGTSAEVLQPGQSPGGNSMTSTTWPTGL